jgi:TetR/AcrR family transcriptional regulator
MVNKPAPARRSPARAASEHSPGTRRRRARGRPRSGATDDVREKLLASARDLFLRYGYRSVSSRQIATAAGANVAMIRYYFGGKPGLYKEVCSGVIQPVRARIDAMTDGTTHVEIGVLLGAAMRMWATNPWLPGLIIREVLMPDGPLRAMFVREFPERLVPLVEKLVRQEMERGHLRADLDPKLTVLSMISLGLFPFLALPVTSKVFGVRQDEEFLQRLVHHTTELLARGLAGPAAPEKKS